MFTLHALVSVNRVTAWSIPPELPKVSLFFSCH